MSIQFESADNNGGQRIYAQCQMCAVYLWWHDRRVSLRNRTLSSAQPGALFVPQRHHWVYLRGAPRR